MKGKLKLNQLNKAEMEKRELNHLRGGCLCSCGCTDSLEQVSPQNQYYGGSSNSGCAVDTCDGTSDW